MDRHITLLEFANNYINKHQVDITEQTYQIPFLHAAIAAGYRNVKYVLQFVEEYGHYTYREDLVRTLQHFEQDRVMYCAPTLPSRIRSAHPIVDAPIEIKTVADQRVKGVVRKLEGRDYYFYSAGGTVVIKLDDIAEYYYL